MQQISIGFGTILENIQKIIERCKNHQIYFISVILMIMIENFSSYSWQKTWSLEKGQIYIDLSIKDVMYVWSVMILVTAELILFYINFDIK